MDQYHEGMNHGDFCYICGKQIYREEELEECMCLHCQKMLSEKLKRNWEKCTYQK